MSVELKESSITQSVTFADYGGGRNSMTTTRSLNLDFQPTKVVFKQLLYSTGGGNTNLYLLWCSLTNDYIGSFHIVDNVIVCEPYTTFQIYTWPSEISFRTDALNGQGKPVPSPTLGSYWSISLDFIKD